LIGGIAEKRKKPALMVLMELRCRWCLRWEAPIFVRVNQVLVRLWARPSRCLTERLCVQRWCGVQRRLLCAERE
jgi:hypothetical protein